MLANDDAALTARGNGELTAEDTPLATTAAQTASRPRMEWPGALAEVLLCSGFPTQIVIVMMLAALGLPIPATTGALSLSYLVLLSLLDTLLLLGLVFAFIRVRRESPRELFVGARPWPREAIAGILLVPVVFLVVGGMGFVIERVAPWLHNVLENPLASLIKQPRDAVVMAFVVIVAGGVREELQRAFILRRFEQHLGGAWLGLVLFSAAFGLGHLLQGRDAALTVGVLGALWGAVYIRRRSVIAPMVCHAIFNLVMLTRFGHTP